MTTSGKESAKATGRKIFQASLIWTAWLICFSLCLLVLSYQGALRPPEISEADLAPGKESHAGNSGEARHSARGFQVNPSLQDAGAQHFALLGPHGLLTGPDINASLPVINNRGQVVVEAEANADPLAVFTVPEPNPAVVLPMKISPDPEAVKIKIAAKKQELCDDAAFKKALGKFEAELAGKNFSQRANQIPEAGLGPVIKKYARQHGVDARLVWAVMRQESGFNPKAVSPKGAMGLMQLIPSTAALMGVDDPFDPEQNIQGGVKFLKICLNRFNNNVVLALAAYNAGPEAVARYQGCPPYAETRNYVLKVMRDYTGKEVALPLLAAAPGRERLKGKETPVSAAADGSPPPPSGLDWKLPNAKFKVAGPTWKLPLRASIIAGQIPEVVRQNPEVARLLANRSRNLPSK